MPDTTLDYAACREALRQRLGEPAPGRIQLVTGPRQVGKTTLLLELATELGRRAARYAAGDGPELALPGAWDQLWADVERRAATGSAVLLLDEVHHLPEWAARLKARWDRVRRLRLPVHVVATGSAALRLLGGSRESLAGRFERLTLAQWSAGAVAEAFGVDLETAAQLAVEVGTYPGAMALRHDPARWRAYVRDAIIEPAIGRDVLSLGAVRKPALLRQVFAVAVDSPARIVSLQKLQGRLQDAGALETVAHYLRLLEEAYLVAALEKFSGRAARRRAAPPKLIALNNALLSAMHPDGAPERTRAPERFGTWVENACLASAVNRGQRVTYWREEPVEVDAVIDGSWGRWAVEVKTAGFGPADLKGLLEFTRRHPSYRPLVLTAPGDEPLATTLGLPAMSWKTFLAAGPAGAA